MGAFVMRRLTTKLALVVVAGAVLASTVLVSAPPAGAVVAGSVAISGPASANVGTNVQFTVSYSCSGDEDCLNVSIDVTYVGMDPVGAQSFSVGTISSGTVGQVFVSGRFPNTTANGSTGIATAQMSMSNASGTSDSASVTAVNVTPTSLGVNVSGPANADIGTNFDITVDYWCSGTDDCQDVVIDVSPAVMNAVSSTSFSIGTVATGTSGTLTVTMVFPPGTSHGSVGTATASGTTSSGSDGSDSHWVSAVDSTTPRAGVDVGGPDHEVSGVDIPFQIVYSCGSQGSCLDMVVTVSFTTLVGTGTTSWNIGTVPAGGSGLLNTTGRFPPGTPYGTYGYVTATVDISNGFDASDTWAIWCSDTTGNTTTTTTTTTIPPMAGFNGYKSRSAAVVPIGDSVDWRFDTNSIGSLEADGLMWTDEFEPELAPAQIYTGMWSPSTVQAHFEMKRSGGWQNIGTFDGNSAAWYVLPAGVRAIRVSYSDLSASTVPLSFNVTDPHRVTTQAIRPDRDGNWYTAPKSVGNCGDWTSVNAGSATYRSSVSVITPAARPDPRVWSESSNLRPTDDISFLVRMANHSSAQLPLVNPFISVLLPTEVEFVTTETLSAGVSPTVTVTNDYAGTGRTLVRFEVIGSRFPGEWSDFRIRAKVSMGVPPGWHPVQVLSGTNSTTHDVECYSSKATDNYDQDQDGDTAEQLCAGNASFDVVEAALTTATMWVQGDPTLPHLDWATLAAPTVACPDSGGYTNYPCVAQTKSLGSADFRLEIYNAGNVDLEELAFYNTLPFVGDTGVTEVLSGTLRRSEWRPALQSPLIITQAPPGAEVVIEYSVEPNSCRPELSSGGAFPAGCIDDWGPPPTDLRQVQAVRVRAFGGAARWRGGEAIVIEYDMDASHGSPFGGEIGWTSLGYTSVRSDNGLALPPSEPRKTGIMIKRPNNGIGSFVWLDANRSGTQDPGEPGINGVQVELYRSDGSLARTTFTADLQGDPTKPGYYFFGDVPAGDYYVRFGPPKPGWNAMLPNQGGDDSIDSDGAIATLETPVLNLGPDEFELDWDMAYFVPSGPVECPDEAEVYDPTANPSDRREVNDRLPCPS
ncbi:MAG: hypothetical protein KDB16_01180 [Acidimicrobiales bacterium]|nr:hypothetical protein [Acidimicrobiales bacterium]